MVNKYFDNAATTPMSEEAIQAYMEAAKFYYGNTSSLHDIGGRASELLEGCRSYLAGLLHVEDKSVVFTSGGTESNLLAIQTLLHNTDKKHIICSSFEHSSIHLYLKRLVSEGYTLDFLAHSPDGTISTEHLKKLIQEQTALVVVQHGNSETGILQPIKEIGDMLAEKDISLHVDCVQTFCKVDCTHFLEKVSSISISGHKINGPKGIGAIIFRDGQKLKPCLTGVTHEGGFRPGTVDVPAVCSFIAAIQSNIVTMAADYRELQSLRSLFVDNLNPETINIRIIEAGEPNKQLPHIICLSFPHIQGQYMMLELNRRQFSVSTGSACQVGNQNPSMALLAMGLSEDEAKSTIRVSLGKGNSKEDCILLAHAISQIIAALQGATLTGK